MKETRYSDAGVDISAANKAKRMISSTVRSTQGPSVLGGIGGFGGLFTTESLPADAVLVSSIDGVGTKLKIAFILDKHDSVGCDLVNHCVNDILVQGAQSLFFMDYLACGQLKPGIVEQVVFGIAKACKANGCALLGGETAEMPGFYNEGEYDLAGTIVGVVARDDLITGQTVKPGDTILGLASSGLHTNGYSLARKVLMEMAAIPLDQIHPDLGRTLGEELLQPHRSYAPSVLPLLEIYDVHGLIHITGGGFGGNIPRVVPENFKTVIRKETWPVPAIFRLIAELGNVPEDEMFATFNMGIGMLMIVPQNHAEKISERLVRTGETVYRIGHIEEREHGEESVVFAEG
jgi:phosphoribosylformylglycinamidine cyclo-ligase